MGFDKREENREVFEHTMHLCETNERLKQTINASEAKQYIIKEQEEISVEKTKKYPEPAKIIVSKKRSLEAAGNDMYKGLKVCVHNFASATNPGGGVVNGASAQEECLCRCSTLYPNLSINAIRQEFYGKHKSLLKANKMNATYNDDCIFTPGVLVFKTDDDDYRLLDEAQWYSVDIITCAAPNLREKPSNAMNPNSGSKAVQVSEKQLKELHEKRLRKILSIAKKEKEEVVILGAFGCGAFQNPPEIVAEAFAEVIQEFLYDFQVIEFAVYCTPKAMKNYDTFYRTFKEQETKMTCEQVYDTGLLYHHYANTAYPLTPTSFMQYKLTDEKEIYDFVCEEWKNVEELSLYIHVPFCKARCKFCEYVVIENPSEALEDEYVSLLLKEMELYSRILKDKKIVGYDLGGGTPAKLSLENLNKITTAIHKLFQIQENVVFSIETTPVIAASEPEKIKAIREMGYQRISMGVQTVSEKLLSELGRDGSKSIYEKAAANIRNAGFEGFNIDLMYGFLNQSERDFDNTLHYAIGLKPDYITLYRNRYKGTKIEYEAGGVSIYKAMYQYRIAYRVLTENGYMANVGKNTFSRVPDNYGTSDYLTKRVIEGTPYVGMGLGAQSFGMNYLAYNLGAAEKKMERYRDAIRRGVLPFQDIYRLPLEESVAKMVSVAFYFAFVDMAAFRKRFGIDFREKFRDEVAFVLENGLMEIKGNRIYLTERGSDYINGVIPLFYSKRSKTELQSAFAKKGRDAKSDEELFLSSYRMEDYDRPSVTTDVVAFTVRSEEDESWRKDSKTSNLSILLIRRGEHPFMNHWALPGGFLKMDETLEECALREIMEEAGVTPVSIMPVGTFSACDRDPRGRIISNAFTTIISEESARIMASDDAIDAKWFDVFYEQKENGNYRLKFVKEDLTLEAELAVKGKQFGRTTFEIVDSGNLAFDHAVIIASALESLRDKAEGFEAIFDFLPEKFTLTALQKVQETILNVSLLPANFRRKIADYVVETEEYTTGAGHRPAKLYRRKENEGTILSKNSANR